MRVFHKIWTIAKTEWKLQSRSIVFWVGLSIILLYSLSQVIGTPKELIFRIRSWIDIRYESLAWSSVVLAFLIPSALLRDQRVSLLLWSKPIQGWVYVFGKIVGSVLTALSLGGLELFTQLVARSAGLHSLAGQKLTIVLESTLYWLTGLFLITSLYFLFTALSKTRAWLAYTLCITVFISLFFITDAANPLCLVPFPAFLSDLVGHGPESPLLRAHIGVFLSLSVAACILGTRAFLSLYKRQFIVSTKNMNVLLAGAVIAFVGLGFSLAEFGNAAKKVLNPQGTTLPAAGENQHNRLDSTIYAVDIDADIDLEDGSVEGTAAFSFHTPLPQVHFYLPAGLRIHNASNCVGQEFDQISTGTNWIAIPGSAQLCIDFAGKWLINRDRYRRNGHVSFEAQDMNAGMYAGEGYVMMMPTARWFPSPVGSFEDTANYSVSVSIPSGHAAFATPAPLMKSTGANSQYQWTSENGYPFLSFAAGSYEKVTTDNGMDVWVAPEHKGAAQGALNFFLDFFLPFEQLRLAQLQDYTVVETPVLRLAVITDSVIFLPESYFTDRFVPPSNTAYYQSVKLDGEEKAYQRELYTIVRGWLQGHIHAADPKYPYTIDTLGMAIDPDIPDGLAGYSPFQEALSQYLTLQLGDHRFGTNMQLELLAPKASSEMTPLARSSSSYTGDFYLVLGSFSELEQQIGKTALNRLIFQFVDDFYGRSILSSDWFDYVEKAVSR